jgi:hypothetical protein
MLGEGFAGPESHAGHVARRLKGPARLFATLDHAEDLELRFMVSAPESREVLVRVNGREAGRFPAAGGWCEARLRVPESFWRREINEVALVPSGDGVRLERVVFVRVGPNPRRWA